MLNRPNPNLLTGWYMRVRSEVYALYSREPLLITNSSAFTVQQFWHIITHALMQTHTLPQTTKFIALPAKIQFIPAECLMPWTQQSNLFMLLWLEGGTIKLSLAAKESAVQKTSRYSRNFGKSFFFFNYEHSVTLTLSLMVANQLFAGHSESSQHSGSGWGHHHTQVGQKNKNKKKGSVYTKCGHTYIYI